MFTGLIESVGQVAAVAARPDGLEISVTTALAPELRPGESVAVNGVCLTVTQAERRHLRADIGPETVRVTTLGSLRPGQPVNLERAMRAGSRFGGHFVQGHVDGVARVRRLRPDGDAHWLTIDCPAALAPFMIRKGSIAVDGVSLTVADLRGGEFDVMIIPFTWQHTSLSSLQAADSVNLECDMIGKYVARAVELARETPG